MQDNEFPNKRERTPDIPETPQSHVITDLPGKEPKRQPKDLPSPRRRPGEPILYDPPAEDGMSRIPVMDPTYDPMSGMSMNDPLEFK